MANDTSSGSSSNGLPTGEQIAKWKAEYGQIIGIDEPYTMIFRRPSKHIWAEFVEHVAKHKGTHDAAYRRLFLACVLYPPLERAGVILDEYPGLSLTIGDELGELAGHRGAIDVKKL